MKLWKQSLVARLIITLTAFALAVGCVSGLVTYIQARKALRDSVFARLQVVANLKEDELTRWARQQVQDAQILTQFNRLGLNFQTLLAADPSGTEYQAAYAWLMSFFDTQLNNHQSWEEIQLLDIRNGRVLIATDPSHEGDYRIQDEYFIHGRYGQYMQSVYLSPVTLQPQMTVAMPFNNPENQSVGVLVVHLSLNYLDQVVLNRTGLGKTGRTFLVGSTTQVVSNEELDPSQRGIHTPGIDAAVMQHKDGQGLYVNELGRPVVGVYLWMEQHDMALLAEIDQTEAFAPARRLGWTIFLIGVGLSALLVVGMYLLALQIARPVIAIKNAAIQVAAGDLKYRAPVLTQDEVGVLATTFNQMTAQLDTLYQSLQRSEAYFRALIENASDLILVLNSNGTIRYASPFFERILGYESDDFLENLVFDFIHPEDEPYTRHKFERSIQQRATSVPFEVRTRRKDGQWRTLEVLGRNCMGDGVVDGFLINARDITERKQAELEVQRRMENLKALHTIDTAINSGPDLGLILSVILEQVLSQLQVDAAAVLILDPRTGLLQQCAGHGLSSGAIRPPLSAQQSLAAQAVVEQQVVYIHALEGEVVPEPEAHLVRAEGFISYYAAPLVSSGRVRGVLEVFHRQPLALHPNRLSFLETLAGQTSLALENVTLFNDLEHANQELALAYDQTIEGWSRALDLRDRETEGHTRRVADMTVRLAVAMGFHGLELSYVRWGALLHDIGKMGVPDAILNKPARLNPEELEWMRRHPQYAYDMLAPIEFLRPAMDIPFCHHERWDGLGYPRGLKGEEIPITARLFAVVDNWDALRSDRPYRAAWPDEQVLRYIRENAGTYFDPQVVALFLRLLSEE